MIVIVSSNEENTIQEIVAWLSYFKKEWCVIEHSDLENVIESVVISDYDENLSFVCLDKKFSMEDIEMTWFRKTAANKKYGFEQIANKPVLHKRVLFHLDRELLGFKNAVYELLIDSKTCLGDPYKNDINKVYSLIQAKKVGLKIPSSLITTKRSIGNLFLDHNSKIITKTIQDSIMVWQDDKSYTLYTNSVEKSDFNIQKEAFFPSLFQNEIIKDYEIRVFYLDEICYSMAIFSQNDQKTQVDFRDYNWKKMNRMVPYNLPNEINDKIIKFMKAIKLNTGSIDLIKSIDGDYVFLEINPVGQFGFVSNHCNYYLEKKMSKYLANYEN
jgi:ATP-GRASP peptide maturase of grasp-with-spasm system